jgi:hypothetical protein
MLIPVSRHRVIFQKHYLVKTGPKTQVTISNRKDILNTIAARITL